MKRLTVIAMAKAATGAAFALVTGGVLAQGAGAPDAAPNFASADTDKDGLLSISEVKTALPDVEIEDENADGFVNQSEAESAIAGLAFESNGYTGGSSLVSEPEYGLIVSVLEDGPVGAGIVDDTTEGASLENTRD